MKLRSNTGRRNEEDRTCFRDPSPVVSASPLYAHEGGERRAAVSRDIGYSDSPAASRASALFA